MKNLSTGYLNKKVLLKRILIITAFAIAVAAFVIAIKGNVMSLCTNPEQIKNYIKNKGVYGILIFLGLQIIQIIVAFIPGEPLQLAGGYLYGTVNGFLLSTAGIMVGSIIAFIISRKFGYPIVSKLVKKEKLLKYRKKIESKKGLIIVFILCLIPGVPKDALVYTAGLTTLKFNVFFLIYLIARIPAMLLASYMGAQIGHYNTIQLIEISAGLFLAIGIFYLYRKQMIKNFKSIKMRKLSD